jgi:HK97 family phage prohead protease
MAKQYLNLTVSRKSLNFDDAKGTFSGYGSVFGNEDLNGDIVEKGAYTNTIQTATKARGSNPFLWPLLWMHDENNPVGGILSAKEDSTGLFITAQCDLDTEMGRRTFSALQKGYMDCLSIGYNAVRSTYDAKGVRHLTEIKLWELSVITVGYAANPLALVNAGSVKSQSGKARSMSKSESEAVFAQIMQAMIGPDAGKPRRAAAPAGPDRKAYASDAAYKAAAGEWRFAPVRDAQCISDEAHRRAALDAQLAAKCRLGLASLAELREYERTTGQTQHGGRVDDTTGRVYRAYDAMEITLEKARRGVLPEGW